MKEKEYDLLGLKIIVKYVDSVYDETDGCWLFGQVEYIGDVNIITISTKDKNGKPMSKKSMRRTLRHELFHSIMAKGQYHNTAGDEPLVEWLALCTDLLFEQGIKI